jgi:hypothetical protein
MRAKLPQEMEHIQKEFADSIAQAIAQKRFSAIVISSWSTDRHYGGNAYGALANSYTLSQTLPLSRIYRPYMLGAVGKLDVYVPKKEPKAEEKKE